MRDLAAAARRSQGLVRTSVVLCPWLVLPYFQPKFRSDELDLQPHGGLAAASCRVSRCCLFIADRNYMVRISNCADGFHSSPGPALSYYRRATAGRSVVGTHR